MTLFSLAILEPAIGSKSSPVKQSKDIGSLNLPETIGETTSHDQKKKRDVEDGEIFKVFSDDDSEEDSFDDNVEHSNGKNNPILHATIKEVAATAHDNAERKCRPRLRTIELIIRNEPFFFCRSGRDR